MAASDLNRNSRVAFVPGSPLLTATAWTRPGRAQFAGPFCDTAIAGDEPHPWDRDLLSFELRCVLGAAIAV